MIYRILAITVMALFYGCHFFKMLSQKKRGIRTNQMGRGKTGFVKAVELLLGAATVLAPCAELVSVILGTTLFSAPLRIVGAVLACAGVAVFICAVITMRDSWRAGVPESDKTELVTGGIFAYSRNPAFLGFDMVYIGILLMFFNFVLLAFTMFAMLMIHLQIVNVEEDFLLDAFGEDYAEYKKRVNRYIGRRAG